MAQISGLQILSICFLLLGAGCEGGPTSSLSDSESYIDKCEYIKCPEIPETETAAETAAAAAATLCPADSSIEVKEFYGIQLNLFQFSHDTRAKRDLQSKCCNTPRCRCNQCPAKPHCKADEVLIELSPGNGQPGSCCTQYKCGKEPVCEGSGINYWIDSCIKCNSCRGPCMHLCTEPSPPSNCLTNVGEIKVNGMSWIEDRGCVNCTCSEGKRSCDVPQCKKAECENPITLPDVCCPVCPTNSTTATSTTSTTSTTTTTTEAAWTPSSTTSVEITTTERIQTDVEQSSLAQSEKSTSTISSSTTTLEPLEETTNIAQLPTVEEPKSIEVEIPVELTEESVEEMPVTVSNLETEISEELFSSSTSTMLKEEEEEKTEEKEEKEDEKTEQKTEEKEEEKAEEKAADKEEKEESMEEEKDEQQTADNLEDTTMDTPEIQSSSSTFSTSSPAYPVDSTFPTSTVTTEHPNAPATSSPAALTPESTSWHRDTNINDEDYRLASASPSDARHPAYLTPVLKVAAGVIVSLVLAILTIYIVRAMQRRKALYSSVPHSDCNLSENTNVSDLVLCIEQPDDHNLPQKQLKESVE